MQKHNFVPKLFIYSKKLTEDQQNQNLNKFIILMKTKINEKLFEQIKIL